jgi:drug/metabolite transporter (DMT)-like permease
MSIPLTVLLLVVASSLGWSGFDLLRQFLVRQIPPVALVFLLTVGSVPLFAAWLVTAGVTAPEPGYLAPALGSVLLNVAANLLFLQGMRLAPISVTVPLLSLTPVFTTLMAIPLLGERPSARGAVGILLVILGAIWLNWPQSSPAAPAQRGGSPWGAALVIGTALLWSLTIPLDKLAVQRATPPFHALVLTAGVATAGFLALLVRGGLDDLARVRRVPILFVLALVVSSAALGLQFLAFPRIFVGTLETMKRGIGNGMALVWGRIFFREAVTWSKILAVGLMAAGVGLILGF